MPKVLLKYFLYFVAMSLFASSEDIAPEQACHPDCKWQCDDPVCPAICTPVCAETLCTDTASCTNPQCECSSFGPLETVNCEPLANDCPLCEVKRPGIDCRDSVGASCECSVQCETKECVLECQIPACPKPKCELICQNPIC